MKCLHCGHQNSGPWQFCFQSCADDYRAEQHIAQEADEIDPDDFEALEALYSHYTPEEDYSAFADDIGDLEGCAIDYPAGADYV